MSSEIYYFNNAATTWPKPKNVINAVNNYFNNPPINSSRHCNCIKTDKDIDVQCKDTISDLFNVNRSKYDITITNGATYSANIVINYFSKLYNNDITLIVDNSAHNSIYRTHFEKIGTKPIIFDNWIEPLDYLVFDDKNYYVAISHVNNVDGTLIDDKKLEDIFCLFRPFNIPIILDITQSAGTYDIDISKYNYDNLYVICSGHKGLYSTTGIGFLISPKDRINIPFISGGTGGANSIDYKNTRSLEAGTPNELAMVSLVEGIKYLQQKGLSNVRIWKQMLTDYFILELYSLPNLDKFSKIFELCPYYSREQSGIIAFKNLDKNKCLEFITKLTKDYHVIIRNGVHCAPLYHINWLDCEATMRISFSTFNTKIEIDYLISSIQKITDTII